MDAQTMDRLARYCTGADDCTCGGCQLSRRFTAGVTLLHILSATALSDGSHLAMCGHVFPSYAEGVAQGHAVGNYLPRAATLGAYHGRGVDCEACIVRHQQ